MADEDIRKELEQLEKDYEGFWETAKMTKRESAERFMEIEFGLGDKTERDKALYAAGRDASTESHYRDMVWRIKKILGKPYEWIRDGWCCAGCRPSNPNGGGLYGK